MKKILTMILSFLFLFTLSACGNMPWETGGDVSGPLKITNVTTDQMFYEEGENVLLTISAESLEGILIEEISFNDGEALLSEDDGVYVNEADNEIQVSFFSMLSEEFRVGIDYIKYSKDGNNYTYEGTILNRTTLRKVDSVEVSDTVFSVNTFEIKGDSEDVRFGETVELEIRIDNVPDGVIIRGFQTNLGRISVRDDQMQSGRANFTITHFLPQSAESSEYAIQINEVLFMQEDVSSVHDFLNSGQTEGNNYTSITLTPSPVSIMAVHFARGADGFALMNNDVVAERADGEAPEDLISFAVTVTNRDNVTITGMKFFVNGELTTFRDFEYNDDTQLVKSDFNFPNAADYEIRFAGIEYGDGKSVNYLNAPVYNVRVYDKLISSIDDLLYINENPSGRYLLKENVDYDSSLSSIITSTFEGTLDGNGKRIKIGGTNAPLFEEIGESGSVYDLGYMPLVAGEFEGGLFANVNRGSIRRVSMTGFSFITTHNYPIAGFVHTNESTGTIKDVEFNAGHVDVNVAEELYYFNYENNGSIRNVSITIGNIEGNVATSTHKITRLFFTTKINNGDFRDSWLTSSSLNLENVGAILPDLYGGDYEPHVPAYFVGPFENRGDFKRVYTSERFTDLFVNPYEIMYVAKDLGTYFSTRNREAFEVLVSDGNGGGIIDSLHEEYLLDRVIEENGPHSWENHLQDIANQDWRPFQRGIIINPFVLFYLENGSSVQRGITASEMTSFLLGLGFDTEYWTLPSVTYGAPKLR
jgi:hypothetical protein